MGFVEKLFRVNPKMTANVLTEAIFACTCPHSRVLLMAAKFPVSHRERYDSILYLFEFFAWALVECIFRGPVKCICDLKSAVRTVELVVRLAGCAGFKEK